MRVARFSKRVTYYDRLRLRVTYTLLEVTYTLLKVTYTLPKVTYTYYVISLGVTYKTRRTFKKCVALPGDIRRSRGGSTAYFEENWCY